MFEFRTDKELYYTRWYEVILDPTNENFETGKQIYIDIFNKLDSMIKIDYSSLDDKSYIFTKYLRQVENHLLLHYYLINNSDNAKYYFTLFFNIDIDDFITHISNTITTIHDIIFEKDNENISLF